MKSSLATTSSPAIHTRPSRRIALRTRGRSQGPITRFMSPGDLGQLVKPFVFLDYFNTQRFEGRGFAAHPHSGIATHTTLIRGAFDYGDSTGKTGTLREGNVEWMQAGGGVWHWGDPHPGGEVRGYQLWIALPAELEHSPARSLYLDTAHAESDGTARVLLGAYGGLRSGIPYHEPVTYLHVTLKAGERWTYEPDTSHDIAWLAVNRGALVTSGLRVEDEMIVFEEGTDTIEVEASGATEFVIGSARKHPHPLITGYYSVHTSKEALARGEREIDDIGHTSRVRAAIQRTSR